MQAAGRGEDTHFIFCSTYRGKHMIQKLIGQMILIKNPQGKKVIWTLALRHIQAFVRGNQYTAATQNIRCFSVMPSLLSVSGKRGNVRIFWDWKRTLHRKIKLVLLTDVCTQFLCDIYFIWGGGHPASASQMLGLWVYVITDQIIVGHLVKLHVNNGSWSLKCLR